MKSSIYLALLLSLTVTGCGGGGSSSGPDVQPPQAVDSDNDGVPDSTDAFPSDASESVDTDGDGIGNNADLDDDNDGVNDSDDAFPLDRSESKDTDGDGIGNNADTDDDNDGVPDEQDDLPENSEESVDTDGDGIGDNADTDDDNDGVEDQHDIFPLDPTESIDSDGDGIGNNADTDDDNDGVEDANDAFPLDPTESIDTDGDGIGNNADTDDDNDGVEDANDAFPLDPTESIDTDGDGIGNNTDKDDDNDSYSDNEEVAYGFDPLDPQNYPVAAHWHNSKGPASGNRLVTTRLDVQRFSKLWSIDLPDGQSRSNRHEIVEIDGSVALDGRRIYVLDNETSTPVNKYTNARGGILQNYFEGGLYTSTYKESVMNEFGDLTSYSQLMLLEQSSGVLSRVSFGSNMVQFGHNGRLYVENSNRFMGWKKYPFAYGNEVLMYGPSGFTVDNSHLYSLHEQNNEIWAMNESAGEVERKFTADSTLVGLPVLGFNEDLFIAANDYDELYSFNRVTGQLNWKTSVSKPYSETILRVSSTLDKVIYTSGAFLEVLDRRNGESIWSTNISKGQPFRVVSMITTLSHVFVAGLEQTLVFDLAAGELVATFPYGGNLIVDHEEVLYIHSYSYEVDNFHNRLTAVHLNTPVNDNDQDGIEDLADSDDDNDGVADTVDVFPFNDLETSDNDYDGIGDNQDNDDDNDGLDDQSELSLGTNPLSRDSDGDKFSDDWEVKYGLNPLVQDNHGIDHDGDGFDLLTEYHMNTDPFDRYILPQSADWSGDAVNPQSNSLIGQKIDFNKLLEPQIVEQDLGAVSTANNGQFIFKYRNRFVLFDMNSLKSLWSKEFPTDEQGEYHVERGFFSDKELVILLSQEDRKILRRFSLADGSELDGNVVFDSASQLVRGDDGNLYIMDSNGFKSVSLDGLTELWTVDSLLANDSYTPVYSDGHLYYVKAGFGLVKFNVETKSVKSGQKSLGLVDVGQSILGFNKMLFTTAGPIDNRELLAFDTVTQRLKWRTKAGRLFRSDANYNSPQRYFTSPAVGLGKVFMVADNLVKGFDQYTGEHIWTFALSTDEIIYSNLIVTNGYVFVRTQQAIYAVDLVTREVTHTFDASTNMLIQDDRLILRNSFKTHIYDMAIDSDADGIYDWYEKAHQLDWLSADDVLLDKDGDGLNNLTEFQLRSSASHSDTDDDGLSDGDEVNTFGTDPSATDTDGDGLPDGWEVQNGFSATQAQYYQDSDNDGFFDLEEMQQDTDPRNADSRIDTVEQLHFSFEDGQIPESWSTEGMISSHVPKLSVEAMETTDGEFALKFSSGWLKLPMWFDGNWVSFDVRNDCDWEITMNIELKSNTIANVKNSLVRFDRELGNKWDTIRFFVQRGHQTLQIGTISDDRCPMFIDNIRAERANAEDVKKWQYFFKDRWEVNLFGVSVDDSQIDLIAPPYFDSWAIYSQYGPFTNLLSHNPLTIATLDASSKRWIPMVLDVDDSLPLDDFYVRQLQRYEHYLLLKVEFKDAPNEETFHFYVIDMNSNEVIISAQVPTDFSYKLNRDGLIYLVSYYRDWGYRYNLAVPDEIVQLSDNSRFDTLSIRENGDWIRFGYFDNEAKIARIDNTNTIINSYSLEVGHEEVILSDAGDSNIGFFSLRAESYRGPYLVEYFKLNESLELQQSKQIPIPFKGVGTSMETYRTGVDW